MPTLETSSPALLDTNVLVYAMDEDAPHHDACRRLRDEGLAGRISLCITPQILFEYFAVTTHPRTLPTPLTPSEARADIEALAAALPVLATPADLHARVIELLLATGASGRRVFDLSIAATMLANGVTHIHTFDEGFAKVPGITRVTP